MDIKLKGNGGIFVITKPYMKADMLKIDGRGVIRLQMDVQSENIISSLYIWVANIEYK